jgi:hypothetical protein
MGEGESGSEGGFISCCNTVFVSACMPPYLPFSQSPLCFQRLPQLGHCR